MPTLCTGCRGCQVACKQWNDLEATKTTNTGSYQNPPRLSAKTWLIMKFNEVESRTAQCKFVFGRHACMHCEHPGMRHGLSPGGAAQDRGRARPLPSRPLLRLSLLHAGLPLRDPDL